MEENEKRAERYRRGLETRLKAVEGNVMDLEKMLKLGVLSIKEDQYELRNVVERDEEGMKRDNEGDDEVTEEESEEEETKGDEENKGEKEDREDEKKKDKDKDEEKKDEV